MNLQGNITAYKAAIELKELVDQIVQDYQHPKCTEIFKDELIQVLTGISKVAKLIIRDINSNVN